MICSTSNSETSRPFFSICVPQHNRTGLLIDALQVLKAQSFQSFEVCISEDCSTDGRQEELTQFLHSSGLRFAYATAEKNLRYDANLRKSISLAQGEFCVLFGNDDCLADTDTLLSIHTMLQEDPKIGALIGNFRDWRSEEVTHRIQCDGIYPGTSATAVKHFRNLAFVSGLVIHRESAQKVATSEVDGSEMYQMFVFSRVIASGWKLRETTQSLVKKDLATSNDFVDAYVRATRLNPCPIEVRTRPFGKIAQVVATAVAPFQPNSLRRRESEQILRQLYLFTYPFWILEHRRIQSWNFAVGIVLGIQPKLVAEGLALGIARRTWIWLLWLFISIGSLILPLAFFNLSRAWLYRLSRSFSK